MRVHACLFALLSGVFSACTWSGGPGPVPAARAAAAVQPVRAPPDTGAPRLVVLARAGSAFDPPGREGLAALSAHAAAAAAGVPVTVGPEIVRWEATPAQATALAAALAASAPPPAALTAARATLAAALRAPPAGDAALEAEVAPVLRFAGHPYGHRPAGRLGALDTLSAAEVQGFRARVHRRSAARLVVYGPALAPAVDALAAALSTWSPAIPQPPTPRTLAPAPTPRTLLLTGGPAGALRIVAGSGAADAPTLAAERIAATALGLRACPVPVRQGWWAGPLTPPTPLPLSTARDAVRAACAALPVPALLELHLAADLLGVASEPAICATVPTVPTAAVEAARAALQARPTLLLRAGPTADGPALADDSALRLRWEDLSR